MTGKCQCGHARCFHVRGQGACLHSLPWFRLCDCDVFIDEDDAAAEELERE